MNIQTIPVVTLSNGLRVANFSSPHPFVFDDGTILGACTDEWARATELASNEGSYPQEIRGIEITNVEVQWGTTEFIRDCLATVEERDDIDILLVPFPLVVALKREVGMWWTSVTTKARTIRLKDRVEKIIYSNKFCV